MFDNKPTSPTVLDEMANASVKFGLKGDKQNEFNACQMCYYLWLKNPSIAMDVVHNGLVGQTFYNLLTYNNPISNEEDIYTTALSYYFLSRAITKGDNTIYSVETRVLLSDYAVSRFQNLIINMLDHKPICNMMGGVAYREFAHEARLLMEFYDLVKYPSVIDENPYKLHKIKRTIESLIKQGFFISTNCHNEQDAFNMGENFHKQLFDYIQRELTK